MKHFFTLLILSFVVSGPTAWAESYRRFVEFEWEEIEGAKLYEVEITQTSPVPEPKKGAAEAPQIFKTKTAQWKGKLTPGLYKMRLRSKDYRSVPGPWSDPSEFPVHLEKVVLKGPSDKIKIVSPESEKHDLEFKWDAVPGAKTYHFVLSSQDGQTKITETLEKNNLKLQLPVAMNYNWSVSALNEFGIGSASPTQQEFILIGKTLENPKISKPENSFVRELRWEKPDKAQGYDVVISKYDPTTKKLKKFKEWQNFQDNTLPFESDWSGGVYQVSIRATAAERGSSSWSRSAFEVQGGDRSPAAEYIATVRKSIERVTGWYAIASYLVTEVTYGNTSADKNTFLNLNAIGGTGRVGMGWFHPKSDWGFIGIADFSGFTVQGQTHTYTAGELNAVYRLFVRDRTEVRLQGGAFYKESPELVASSTITGHTASKVVSAGPHLGGEFWYSLTPKLGFQAHAHTYFSAVGLETPNGQGLNPTLSTQWGLMGSYRFSRNFTGLLGFTMREDKTSYARSSDASNTQFSSNESKITGTYLNFYAEWAF